MANLDRLAALLEQFRVRTRVFHAGPLCGVTDFPAEPGRGFLHVLRRGELQVIVDSESVGGTRTWSIEEPSLIFCPMPIAHAFHNAPVNDSDFACATLDIDGGQTHPLLEALPPLTVVPLAEIPELDDALTLLFAEIDRVRCGSRVLADRLFEVVLIQLFRWLLDRSDHHGLPSGLLNGLADRRLAQAITAVHESPGSSWTLDSMAAEAGMSRSSFAARFKEVVGQTPAAYVAGWRMTLAQSRLRAGASVTRTAHDLGYATGPAFSRAFSSRVGCSPRDWLKTNRRREDLLSRYDRGEADRPL